MYCDYPQYPGVAEGGGGDIYFVENNNWSEKTITWNNKPPFLSSKIDSQGIIKRGNRYRFDVSSVVKGNGTYSFAVMSELNDGGHYLSKEGGSNSGNIPYLKLHLVPKTQNEIIEDTGVYPDYGSDICLSCDDLIIPDENTVEDIAVEPAADTGCNLCDENIDYGIFTDSSGGIPDLVSKDTLKDPAGTGEESTGCGCSQLM